MADNTTLSAGAGGDTIATDDIGGVKHQLVKIEFGAADSATQASSANPFPVVQTGTPGLPTGASTAAKQPALGTAGAASTDVITVQGIASGTVIPVSGTVTANGPLTDTQLRATAVPVSGTVTASGPLTDTQLRATAVPVSGTVTASGPLTDTQLRATAVPISVATIPSHAVTNAGTFAVQDSQKIADDAAFTVGTTPVNPVGFLADQTATDSVDEGDIGAARMTLNRIQIVTLSPSADTAGWSVKNCTSGDGSTALTNTAQAIKASAGKLGGWYIANTNAAAWAYVPIYNVASGSVTVGTTNPLMVIAIPPASAANLEPGNGITFDTAISAAACTTAAGSTALGTAVDANFFFI